MTQRSSRTPASNRRRGARLAAITRRCRSQSGETAGDLAADFARLYFGNLADEDLDERGTADLAAAALAHLRLARTRPPGVPKIRIYNPEPDRDGWQGEHTVIDVVNEDMPFLVDSATLALRRMGCEVQLTVHPIMGVQRDGRNRLRAVSRRHEGAERSRNESYIHFEITREPERSRRRAIAEELAHVFEDVRVAVKDWPAMLAALRAAADELRLSRPRRARAEADEACRLLEWMADDRFTLLGYREYQLRDKSTHTTLEPVPGTGLGLLRQSADDPGSSLTLSEPMLRVARSPQPLFITKSDTPSSVHRPGYLDYVGVKVFDRDGRAVRERRFLGHFTAAAYNRSTRDIPLLRRKVAQVHAASALPASGHRARALQHVLDSLPRDELFQIDAAGLHTLAVGILNLQERHRVRLFMRRDDFLRFYSCLVFLPRDRYTTETQQRLESILSERLDGERVDTRVQVDESSLARLHLIVRTAPEERPMPDTATLESELAAAVATWQDRLRMALMRRFGEAAGLTLLRRWADAFPAAYVDETPAEEAVDDILRLERLRDGDSALESSLYPPAEHSDGSGLRLRLCQCGDPLALSHIVPLLKNLGLSVARERPYRVQLQRTGTASMHVQDMELVPLGGERLDIGELAPRFLDCLHRVLAGEVEDDALNRLVLAAGMTSREAELMRALTRYLVQTGLPFSQPYLEQVLIAHPDLVRALHDLFRARFDPELASRSRATRRRSAERRLREQLDTVNGLDEDRILRGYIELVQATLRTNFYRRDANGEPRSCIALKLDPRQLTELPRPRPRFEVFVCSPRVEGVHLRAGAVARGGLRWSDRREDFRTEVLGLMKAQQVKNTVIVPRGAKGGFVCKRLPASGEREAVQREVRDCYRLFIASLLDITDNVVGGKVVPPPDVVRADGDDPYLVVAADKGTATFSDLANEVAAEYGFWLGDAFASGGSNGYDHKRMGITARGTWEAVKRHFRELGMDVQAQPFTVVGIGDMGGDVFGNGLLLSPHARLLAAFNHRHVFIDPDPDPAVSLAERKRLFAEGAGWDAYNPEAISSGGGVYSRNAKSIELSARAARLLGLKQRSVTPPELIRTVLRMPVDLLFNGGIGTYVKAASESHSDVGDRANDTVRVNGRDLRCRVVAEGGNLGLTAQARVEYSLAGGRVNADFIDNSGGVESSDREVNIKILLAQALRDGALTPASRNRLLGRMEDEVASLVLRTNYQQGQAISVAAARGVTRFSEHVRVIRSLEGAGLLDRTLECLPDEDGIETRREAGQGLTRPELATLISHAKLALVDQLVGSDLPEEPQLQAELLRYFPQPLRERFEPLMSGHRLAREIVAMTVTGSLVNRMGPAFVLRAQEETGADAGTVARAWIIARELSGLRAIWQGIESLDNAVPAKLQYELLFDSSRHLRYATYWVLRHHRGSLDIGALTERLQTPAHTLLTGLHERMTAAGARRHAQGVAQLMQQGLPEHLARALVSLPFATAVLDVVEVAQATGCDLDTCARVHFELGQALKLDWLRGEIESLAVESRWQALGRGTLRASVGDLHRQLLRHYLEHRARETGDATVSDWLHRNRPLVLRALRTLNDMHAGRHMDFASLSVALEELRLLALRLGEALVS